MNEPINLDEWDLVGTVGVDSGQIMVGDPCYLSLFDNEDGDFEAYLPKPNKTSFSYGGACEATCSEEQVGILGGGKAAVSSSGYGDGRYGVYVKRSDEGSWGTRIAAMMTVFIEGDRDEDEDEECFDCGAIIRTPGNERCDECETEHYCDCGNEKDPVYAMCEDCAAEEEE